MILVLFLTAGAFLVAGSVFFDKALKFQYRNYRSEWEKAGKPRGVFWIPSESSLFSLQGNIRILVWTFGDDDWMRNEPAILRTLLYVRCCIFAFWGLCIVILFLSMKNGG